MSSQPQQFALMVAGLLIALLVVSTLFSWYAAHQTLEENPNTQESMSQTSLQRGQTFLEKNKQQPGIEVLPSGLQYKILVPGTGKQPAPQNKVTVHYRGTFIGGKEFDSSYDRGEPTTFGVNRVIPGWVEALLLMKEGAKWKLYIPPHLAYGEMGAGGVISPNETLIFDVELIKVD